MTQKQGPSLTETLEKNLEKKLEELTTHPYFLKTVSQVINLNSQRLVLTRNLLERALEAFELPIRKNQEKILFQLDELKVQISFLENKISELKNENFAANSTVSAFTGSKLNHGDTTHQKRTAKSPVKNQDTLQIL